MKNFLSTEYLKAGAAWLTLLGGVGLYLIGFFLLDADNIWRQIVIKVGDALVIGVVLRFVSDAALFIGIFKKELQDIIYGKKFVGNLKEVYPLWENVSRQLFKDKFKDIDEKFLKTVKNYLPENEVSYYDDYDIHTTIEWQDRENGIIKKTSIISFDLIAAEEGKIVYPIKTYTRTKEGKEFSSKITEITVNDEQPKKEQLGPVSKKRMKDGNLCQEQKLTLEGSKKYSIKYTRVKTYDIKEDYCVGFRAKYIANGMRVCLNLPDDISAIFMCRGTQDDFDTIVNTDHRIEMKYRGIILPRQGYIFSLKYLDTHESTRRHGGIADSPSDQNPLPEAGRKK